MAENGQKLRPGPVLCVFLASVAFRTGGLFIKMVPWSPLAINGARNLIGSLVIGVYLLIRFSGVKLNFFTTTVKPLIGAVASSVTAFFVNMLCMGCKLPQRLSTVIAIVAAAVVYLALLLILRTFSAQEVKILPKGDKIATTLENMGVCGLPDLLHFACRDAYKKDTF